jgi:hypothetical protein
MGSQANAGSVNALTGNRIGKIREKSALFFGGLRKRGKNFDAN